MSSKVLFALFLLILCSSLTNSFLWSSALQRHNNRADCNSILWLESENRAGESDSAGSTDRKLKTSRSNRRTRSKLRDPSIRKSSLVTDLSDPDVIEKVLSSPNSISSKLPPITGSLEDRRAKYNSKGILEKIQDDFLAPTPIGKEPKIIEVAKTVTWVAVLLLVLVEIFVSIKTGGMPFDSTKAATVAPTTSETRPPPPSLSELSILE